MKKILLFGLILTGLNASSQTTNQFSLNFFVPSAEYEAAIGENSSLDGMLGLGFGYHDADYLDEAEFGIFPHLEAQYRYYYNFQKRADKGKKISENSGNYLAAVGFVASGDPVIGDMHLRNNYSAFVGPAWGLQRVYDSNFKLNLNLGAGYGFNDYNESSLQILIDIQLGFKIGK